MNPQLELIINKLRTELENREREHGPTLHARFSLQFDIQDGNITHGNLNGIRFRTPSGKSRNNSVKK